MKDGGPAFPVRERYDDISVTGAPVKCERPGPTGMSLRDYFAAKAMQAILTALHEGIRPTDLQIMALDAYGIADAMLAARAK